MDKEAKQNELSKNWPWATGLCSAHRIPDPDCRVCRGKATPPPSDSGKVREAVEMVKKALKPDAEVSYKDALRVALVALSSSERTSDIGKVRDELREALLSLSAGNRTKTRRHIDQALSALSSEVE